MTIKIIDYDLVNEESSYDDIIDEIKELGVYIQVAKSSWLVKSNLSCSEIRDKLKAVVNKEDRIFVAKLSGESAWSNPIDGSSEVKKFFN